MPSPASSTAIDLDTRFTAALEALYHVSPGRGLIPAVEPILMNHSGLLLAHERDDRMRE